MLSKILLAGSVGAMLASAGHLQFDVRREVAARMLEARDSVDSTLTLGIQGSVYFIDLSIGTPPQTFNLQLDTGSSDLWVPASSASACQVSGGCPGGSFNPSQSSTYQVVLQGKFNITYGDGTSDSGDYFTDVVHLGGDTITNLTMGLALQTGNGPQEQNDGHGLLGVGYPDLETIVAVEGLSGTTPTMYEQLVAEGFIDRAAFSLYLNDYAAGSGSIIFGGIDTTKYSGDLVSLPVQNDPNSPQDNIDGYYVALTGVSITDGSGTRSLTDANFAVAALLDSGTVSQDLPASVANAILTGLGAVDGNVPCSYNTTSAHLTYTFGGAGGPSINVPIGALLLDNGVQFPNGEEQCAVLAGPSDGNGVILGDSFLRSAYVVYDVANNEIAIAQAVLNAQSSSNIVNIPSGTGLPGVSSTATLLLSATSAVQSAAGPTSAINTANVNPLSPTFNLGSATAAGTAASSSGSSKNAGAHSVVVSPVTTWTMFGGLSLTCLLGALAL